MPVLCSLLIDFPFHQLYCFYIRMVFVGLQFIAGIHNSERLDLALAMK